jgi:transposase
MIQLTHQTRILLSIAPASFRYGIDGFVAICQNQLLLDPRDQSVYVFINKAKTMIRALSYDGSGYWLMTKRVSSGKFQGWPTGDRTVSDTTALQLRRILGGTSWTHSETQISPLATAYQSTTLGTHHTAAHTP